MIKDSIQSIINQSYSNIEIIVINDGSQDNTEKKISEIDDSRLKYFRSDINKGVSYSRNLGVKYSSGNIVAFQDSDDIAYPERIEKQLQKLLHSNNNVGAVYCGMELIDKTTGIKIKNSYHDTDFRKNFTEGRNLLTPGTGTLMIRKDVIEHAGYFDEQLFANEDTEIAIRISKLYDYAGISEPLVKVYRNHDQLMSNPYIYIHAKEIIYKKHRDYLSKDILVKLCKTIANYYILTGNLKAAKFYVSEALNIRKDFKTVIQQGALNILPGPTELLYKLKHKKIPLSSGLS